MARKKTSLTDRAYQNVKSEIICGSLLPNQQVAQRQLANKYKLGVTPVREALQRLSHEGLVSPIPRLGYIVNPISVSDVRDVAELRFALEPLAARLAALRASPSDLEQIAKYAEFPTDPDEGEHYSAIEASNIKFHVRIAQASGNCRLVELISRLLDEQKRINALTNAFVKPDEDDLHLERVQIVEAILNRDADRAEELVRSHVVGAHKRTMDVIRLLGGKTEDV